MVAFCNGDDCRLGGFTLYFRAVIRCVTVCRTKWDLLTGGLALYLLALGMGIPLILITLFGNRILPKSGDWLLKVKTAFGFVMLALPVFLLSRILPSHYESFMWSALAMVFVGWLISVIPTQGLIKQAVRIALFLHLRLLLTLGRT
ncbi:thiol:disulfide interchange protein DsbD [Actinobacillus equuli]|nr:thiol:disulfide interchange protein DsbD [Actinobacillus equuli]